MSKHASAKNRRFSFDKWFDFAFLVMKFQLVLAILILYYSYYSSRNKLAFHPGWFLTILGAMFLLQMISLMISNQMVALLASIPAGALLWLFVPVPGNKPVFGVISIVALASTYVAANFSRASDYGIRFQRCRRQEIYQILMIIISLFYLFWQFMDMKHEYENSQPIHLGAFCMMFSYLFFMIACILMRYLIRYLDYYKNIAGIDSQSKSQMVRSFFFVTGVITVLSFFLSVCAAPLRMLLQLVYPLVARVFLIILKLISGASINISDAISKNMTLVSQDGGILKQKAKTHGDGFLFLNNVSKILIPLIIIAFVLLVVWKIYKHLIANYEKGADKAEYIPVYESEETVYEKSSSHRRMVFEDTNNGKIRKYYFRVRKKRMKDKEMIFRTHTPKECVTPCSLDEQDRMAFSELTTYYEKARYGKGQCSEEDMMKSRELADIMTKK